MTRPQKTPRETPNTADQGNLAATATSTWHLRPSHPRGPDASPPEAANAADDALDEGLEDSFPGSDPVSATRRALG